MYAVRNGPIFLARINTTIRIGGRNDRRVITYNYYNSVLRLKDLTLIVKQFDELKNYAQLCFFFHNLFLIILLIELLLVIILVQKS